MSSAISREATRPRGGADWLAGRLAVAGGTLGVLAGLLELTTGPSMREWVGGKLDTTRLGLATIVLGVLALAAATVLRRPGAAAGRRVAIVAGLLLPALTGFTTVGRLWYLPGALLLSAAGLIIRDTTARDAAKAFTERHWRAGLLALCGIYYVFLGATALGVAGVLGVLGGLLLITASRVTSRAPAATYALVLCGALPFALATWWSVITPLVAVVAIVVAHRLLQHRLSGSEDNERTTP